MNFKSNCNYDLTKDSSFFKEFKLQTSPPSNYITNSPFQKKLSTNTPEMTLISVDVNQFNNRYQEGPTIPLFFGTEEEPIQEAQDMFQDMIQDMVQTQDMFQDMIQDMVQTQDMFQELFGEEIQKMNQTQDMFQELFGEEIQNMNQNQDMFQEPQDMLIQDMFQEPQDKMVLRSKQVKIACVNCKKTCKKCNDFRPCLGCQRLGLSEACVDVPRKKRECKTPYHRSKNLKK